MQPSILWDRTQPSITSLLLVLAAGCATHPVAETANSSKPEESKITIGERLTIQSAILKEDRPYLVHLPESYHSKDFAPKKYPVLYLLDGGAHFESASGVVQFMSAGINGNIQTPELIIVAIPNTDRTRDLTPSHTTKGYAGKEAASLASSGGAEAFLQFLSEELIPRIEHDYRTEPYRILVGHSFGGLFAMHAFLHRPQVFQAHIAIDPSLWWDNQLLLRQVKEASDLRGSVYISIAHNHPNEDFDPALGQQACVDFAEFLKQNNSSSFRSTSQYFEAEDHGSVPLLSLYHGLLFLFDGYKPPVAILRDPAAVADHFAKASNRLGFSIPPPEEYINMTGWVNMNYNAATNTALEFLKFNVSTYPNSPNAHASLAEAYELAGEKDLAMTHYQESLTLNPENRFASEHLRRLKPLSDKGAGPLPDGAYCLINKASGQALEVTNASAANGALLGLNKFTNGVHQQWTFQSQGDGYYQVTALHSGKALDVNALSTREGARVMQWQTNGGANQIWHAVANSDGTYRVLNEHSGLALQPVDSKSTNELSLEQRQWRSRANQKWRIKAVAK